MSLAGRAVEVLREEGLAALWWRSLAAVAYRRLTVLVREGPPPPAPPGPEALAMERMGAGDLNQYRRLRPGTPDGEIRRRLGAGEICFLARLDREPIACRWYSLGRAEMPYLGFAFELPDNLAYVRDAFTAPWARGCGLATLLRAYGETLLRDLGARSFITTVLPENVAGLRLTASGGFTPVGRIAALRLPGRRVVLRDPDLEHLGPARPLPVPWSIPAP